MLSPALSQVTHPSCFTMEKRVFRHYQELPEAASEVST